jgi:hypothetical protein
MTTVYVSSIIKPRYMKKILFFLFLMPIGALAQQNEFGHVDHDTLFLTNGAKFVEGQKLKLAYGSGANKTFEFIALSPYSIAGPLKLESRWSNHEMMIKKFTMEGTKKTGKKLYIVLGGGNLSPYWCDIVSAMENGEVIIPGINDKKTVAAADRQPTTSSPADELKKLKDLYDGGALTKDEYDSAKKKILAKM